MGGQCDLSNSRNDHINVDIQPPVDQLPCLLRQLAELLMNQDQKEFLLALVNEAMGLPSSQPATLIRRFMHQTLSYLVICERRDQKRSSSLIRVSTSGISHNEYPFPLTLSMIGNDPTEITANLNAIFINRQEYELKQKAQQLKLDAPMLNSVDLRLSNVNDIWFVNGYTISLLNISHTFICHVDIRQLIDLEELRLMNTRIGRLNLMNQKRLRLLCRNYTRIDYLGLFQRCRLRELHIEYSGQLKMNTIGSRSQICVDGRQIGGNNYCKKRIEKKKKDSYTVVYPKAKSNNEAIKIILPKKCEELAGKNIKQCKKLEIHSFQQYKRSTIGSLDIVDYSNLEDFSINCIDCSHFRIAELPSIVSISIYGSLIRNISIIGFPNLRKAEITYCGQLEQLKIEHCEKVEKLDIQYAKISQLAVKELRELRSLHASCGSITKIDVTRNIKLEELQVHNNNIAELNIKQLVELRTLDASSTNIAQLDVSGNHKLELLDAHYTKITQLDVRQLTELKNLDVSSTGLICIDVSRSTKLEELNVNRTKISQLVVNQLTELKKLYAIGTSIRQIDVSRNTKLEQLNVMNTNLSQLDVSCLAELRSLNSSFSKIACIEVSTSAQLKDLEVNNTKISALDVGQLKQRKRLAIHKTAIKQTDLSANRKLTKVWVSSCCRVWGCCCSVSILD